MISRYLTSVGISMSKSKSLLSSQMVFPFENLQSGELYAGVDEAGRGAWAGPVVAAAVILDPLRPIAGLRDSKKLSADQRAVLAAEIRKNAIAFAIAEGSLEDIEELNILQATLHAMRAAVNRLEIQPKMVLVDGNQTPNCLNMPCQAIVRGDSLVPAISAASIIAKVYRDEKMIELAGQYPCYQFEKHKGYGTDLHAKALNIHGISPIHRRTFSPILKLVR